MVVAVFQMKKHRRVETEDAEGRLQDFMPALESSGVAETSSASMQELLRLYPQHNVHFLLSILEATHGDISDARCLLTQLNNTQPRSSRRKRPLGGLARSASSEEDPAPAAPRLAADAGPLPAPRAADQGGEVPLEEAVTDSLIQALAQSATLAEAKARVQPTVREWMDKARTGDILRRAVLAQTNMLLLAKQRERQSAEARALLEQQLKDSKQHIDDLDRQLRKLRDNNALLAHFIKSKFDEPPPPPPPPPPPFGSNFFGGGGFGFAR